MAQQLETATEQREQTEQPNNGGMTEEVRYLLVVGVVGTLVEALVLALNLLVGAV